MIMFGLVDKHSLENEFLHLILCLEKKMCVLRVDIDDVS